MLMTSTDPLQHNRTDGIVARHDCAAADGVRDGRRGGIEREWRHKASGLRTNMLICMGAALFTMLSPVLAGEMGPNQGQVASNIVQGIGFLGAGLILHTRNRVLGLTSAATVWVVAAVGMACGAGLYIVAAIRDGDRLISRCDLSGCWSRGRGWKRFPMLYEVRGSDEKTMFAAILAVLDREQCG